MKSLFLALIASFFLAQDAAALELTWGVDNLCLPEHGGNELATPTNYGTDLGQFVLQLVWVGENCEYFSDNRLTEGFKVIDSANLLTIPQLTPGSVTYASEITQTGSYLMFLYNNNGAYYTLSGTGVPETAYVVTTEMIDRIPPGIFEYTVTQDNVYCGTMVPEPATATLAVLGLALILKRRKQA